MPVQNETNPYKAPRESATPKRRFSAKGWVRAGLFAVYMGAIGYVGAVMVYFRLGGIVDLGVATAERAALYAWLPRLTELLMFSSAFSGVAALGYCWWHGSTLVRLLSLPPGIVVLWAALQLTQDLIRWL